MIILVGVVALGLLAYQLYIEIRQLMHLESKLDYFKSLVNLIDLYQFGSSIYIIVVNLLEIEVPSKET